VEGLDQSTQHFGSDFKHRLKLGLIDLLNVFAEMVFEILQGLLHFLRVMTQIAVCDTGHVGFAR
jgi:hypothetical protein